MGDDEGSSSLPCIVARVVRTDEELGGSTTMKLALARLTVSVIGAAGRGDG